jgi:hypothetical protein
MDTEITPLEDAGTRLWGFDADHQEIFVGAEYVNPLQYWVATALALADWRTFDQVLDEDRLEELFETVPEAVLRDARNIGGLTDGALAEPDHFVDRLNEWRGDLLEMTRRWRRDEYESDADAFRSDILRAAHGLAGTIVHLLDAADVTVRRILRLPDLRQHFDPGDNAQRRRDLLKTVAFGAAIQSEFESHTAYRLLFESRDDVRDRALGVDLSDIPPGERVGRMIGSFAIIGPNVTDLEGELTRALGNPTEVHEDAPEISIATHVASQHGRDAYAQTIKRVLRSKNLDPTTAAVSMVQAFVGSTYDAARALGRGLQSESEWRSIRLDEVRIALGALEYWRLLPASDYPALQKLLQALFKTAAPVTKTELADLAEVSLDSVSEHLETLVATDLVREAGDQYRFALPFATDDERGDQILPWYAIPTADRGDHRDATLGGVLDDLAQQLVDDPSRFGDPDDIAYRAGLGDLDAVYREWPWIEAVIDAVRELAVQHERDVRGSRTVTFGLSSSQTTIQQSTGGVSA